MHDFSDVERQIQKLCAQHLSDDITEYNQAVQQKMIGWLEGIKAQLEAEQWLDSGGVFSFLNQVIAEYRQTFDLSLPEERKHPPAYLQYIDAHTEKLQEEVVFEQDEGRFFPLENDSPWIVIGKLIKRAGRNVRNAAHTLRNGLKKVIGQSAESPEPYLQQVPLQAIARYHLLNHEQAARQFSDGWNSVQLTLLAELEQFLVHHVPESAGQQGDFKTALQQFVEDKIDEIGQKETQNRDRWQEFLEEIEHVIINKVRRADTFEEPRSRYDYPNITKLRENTDALIRRRSTEWIKAQHQVLNKLDELVDYFIYQQEVNTTNEELSENLSTAKDTLLMQPVSDLIQQIRDVQSAIDDGASVSSFPEKRDELLESLQHKLLDPLGQALVEERFQRLIDEAIEQLLFRSNRLKEEIEIYYEAQWQDYPPQCEVQVLQWQAIVKRRLNNELLNTFRQKKKEIREQLETYSAEFHEVYEVIRVNLDTSTGAEDSTEDPESSQTVAVEGLQRAIAKLEADLDPIKNNQDALRELIQSKTMAFEQQLWDLLTASEAGEFQLQDTSYRVRKKTSDLKKELQFKSETLLDKATLLFRFGKGKTKKGYKQMNRFLGFEQPKIQQEQKADIATYLSETDRRLKELPFVYRKLFSAEAGLDRRFFVPPKESFAKFQKSFEMWEKGFGATSAAIGEKGAGKTTFLDLALEELTPAYAVKRIELEDTIWTEEQLVNTFAKRIGVQAENIEELIDKLNRGKKRKIIVLENLQNGYVRHINGYEAIVNLLLLISETKKSVFWFVSCSTYAWKLLDRVESVGEYFSHIIKVDTLDQQQVQTVIKRRHKVSGFELWFEADEETEANRAFKKLIDDEPSAQAFLEERYFEKLARLAQGNASIAIIVWIRSIRKFDDTHFYIDPLEIASVEVIDDLKQEVLFTLAALILHDTMTPEELAMAINTDIRQSRLIFARLEAKGLLRVSDDIYMLNHLMYRQVVNLLKQRNILHLV